MDINAIEAVEQIKPDPELMALTKRVMDQNDAILRMNGRLLEMLTSPTVHYPGPCNQRMERMRWQD